jgi:hypothetical protein
MYGVPPEFAEFWQRGRSDRAHILPSLVSLRRSRQFILSTSRRSLHMPRARRFLWPPLNLVASARC